MIYPRNPSRDDVRILRLIRSQLLPQTRGLFHRMDEMSDEDLLQRLNRGKTWVDRGRGAAVRGFIHVFDGKKGGLVDMLAVSPRHRRKKIGLRLMRRTEEYFKRKGQRELFLYVTKDNTAGRSFYEKLGYFRHEFDPVVRCYLYRKRM